MVLNWVCEVGELLVSTWDNSQDWRPAGWGFLPPFPTVSDSAFDSLMVAAEDKGEVGIFFSADFGSVALTVDKTMWASFSSFAMKGGRLPGFMLVFSEPSSLGKLRKGD